MKILIISDSHRISSNVELAINRESPDMLIHLGDAEADAAELSRIAGSPQRSCIFIRGNCDRSSEGLRDEAVFTLCHHKFLCCHGHQYRVNYSPLTLSYAAEERGCDIALFGHTHIPFDNYSAGASASPVAAGVHLLNPGSVTLPRAGTANSYMVMTLEPDGAYQVCLKSL